MTPLLVRLSALAACIGALTAPAAYAEPAMWMVKDADSTLYLFGTIHVLRPDQPWLTPRLKAALASCQDLTLEIGDSDADAIAPLMVKYGFDRDHKLSERLSPPDRERLARAVAALGGDPAQFEAMRPWLAGLQLTLGAVVKEGFDAESGVEKQLRTDARAAGEPILAFETAESQIALLAGLPDKVQVAFLTESLDEFDRAAQMLDEMAEAWERGDEAALDRLVNDDMRRTSRTLYERLLVDRNKRFAAQVKARLDGAGTHCVAVGAGHLVGPDSVQAHLKKLGVASERF